ncbi:MAG: MBL fold metallo-hydrolase [Myxococcaceae bacterium]|nr:MBL fold metallo-hydrolase [Myxococcaceae bacterium]
MSEALAGVPAPPPGKPPRAASSVVLFRKAEKGAEVFWLKREKTLAFAGGFYAFPGGKIDAADAAIVVAGAQGDEAARMVAAARELFEETGVLIARGTEQLSQAELDADRKALLDKQTTFAALLKARGLTLEAAPFHKLGRWVTPEFVPGRFDAQFYLVEAPPQMNAVVWPGELSYGAWVKPLDALAQWSTGKALLHPPNLFALQVMAEFSSLENARSTLASPSHCQDFIAQRIEFQKGIRLFPMKSPTLPPATHTNCYVLGNGELLIVDPGTHLEEESQRLLSLLQGLKSEGLKPVAIVLTHHHGDHLGGVDALRAALKLPLWCHALTAERVPWPPDRLLHDGELLELKGSPAMRFKVLHTPGHAVGHVCLVEEQSNAVIAGDMVSGVSTIVIDPPEGNMVQYLEQLRRLKALPAGTLYPAHGQPSPEGVDKLEELLTHRAWREAKVFDALNTAPQSIDTLVKKAYDDVASVVWPIAERNTLAILIKLVDEGRARQDGERYAKL